jgi:E3 ubiquitin-protein ligase SspH2
MSIIQQILQLSNYAQRIIESCPPNTADITIYGDVLYAYLQEHPNRVDAPISYDTLKQYTFEIDSGARERSAGQNTHQHINHYGNLWSQFWEENPPGLGVQESLTIDLTNFPQLQKFHISYLYVYEIINIPESVITLSCKFCQLKKIGEVPEKLEYLNCSGNMIYRLPQIYHTQLKSLFCCGNRLEFLPKLPRMLEWLYCYQNRIRKLPNLPPTLEYLSCAYNQLYILPNIPDTVVSICADNNYIREIPVLPKALKTLFCASNRICKIENLPIFLQRFSCHNNPIVDYGVIPPSVRYLNLHNELWTLE